MEIFKGVNAGLFLVAIFAAGAVLERLRPWRRNLPLDPSRWVRSGLLDFLAAALLGALPFLSGYAAASFAKEQGLGVLNIVGLPVWVGLLLAIVVLDGAAFGQHYLLHRVGPLWRLHRAHHTDRTLDVATALRFHPLEAVFRAATEAPVIILFGLPPEGVLLAFGVFTVVNAYTHFNVAAPLRIERFFAPVLITPMMHRLHHTADETNQRSNLGTLFSLWDSLAGSRLGPDRMKPDAVFGVGAADAPPRESLGAILLDPFRPAGGRAAIAAAVKAEVS